MINIGKFKTVNDWVKILPDDFDVTVRHYDKKMGLRTKVKHWKKAQSYAHVCKVDIDWDKNTAKLTTIVGADDDELLTIDTDKLIEEYNNTKRKHHDRQKEYSDE